MPNGSRSAFCANTHFGRSTFHGPATFEGTTFLDIADFQSTSFNQEATFLACTFTSRVGNTDMLTRGDEPFTVFQDANFSAGVPAEVVPYLPPDQPAR